MDELKATREGVVWIPEMLPRAEVVALLSAATVFACPSIYEPLGIVNLEAMACELPVVATATGGIPEVVVDGETGWLVPIEQKQDGSGIPLDADRFVADLAAALNRRRQRPRPRRPRWGWPGAPRRSTRSPGPPSASAPTRSTSTCCASGAEAQPSTAGLATPGPPPPVLGRRGEVGVHEGYDRGALAAGRRHPLHRARADVAGREDAGHGGGQVGRGQRRRPTGRAARRAR